ncbi:hypothetical protein [Burkholderia contaminans]|uniref:hypothetical protein n=1 Tax=Burkholderia contaminans TaxID=488447 RepID=UPI002659BD7F|nr:hypothetical protein [Burkholderia contaminans]
MAHTLQSKARPRQMPDAWSSLSFEQNPNYSVMIDSAIKHAATPAATIAAKALTL